MMIEQLGIGHCAAGSMIDHIVVMCGISGAFSIALGLLAARSAIRSPCERHRGPDEEGRFSGGRGVIAQNSLAIVDVAEGDPPISN
jgi:asparagine synthetase B (glutamine-hydrolysing)